MVRKEDTVRYVVSSLDSKESACKVCNTLVRIFASSELRFLQMSTQSDERPGAVDARQPALSHSQGRRRVSGPLQTIRRLKLKSWQCIAVVVGGSAVTHSGIWGEDGVDASWPAAASPSLTLYGDKPQAAISVSADMLGLEGSWSSMRDAPYCNGVTWANYAFEAGGCINTDLSETFRGSVDGSTDRFFFATTAM